MQTATRQLFQMGTTLATPAALDVLERAGVAAISLLLRHAAGDWGDVCEEDAAANFDALSFGGRLVSVYRAGAEKVWIITEAGRHATTVLLPSDY